MSSRICSRRWDSGRGVGRWSVCGGVSSGICSRRWDSGCGVGRWSVCGGVSRRVCSGGRNSTGGWR